MSIPRSVDLPTGVRAVAIDTARGPFAALDTGLAPGGGRASAPVVLAPGYTGSKEDFLAILAPLAAAGRRVVAMDLRGQYETAGTDDPGAYDLAELAADVLAIVDAVGGSAHLVGHSFGGFVMRHAAALRGSSELAPPAVRSLTLMSSGPGPITGAGTRAALAMLQDALPVHDMETIWAAKRALDHRLGEPEHPGDVEAFLHRRFVATHPVGLSVAARQLTSPEHRLPAAELDLPLLVLYGAGEDVWAPAEIADMAVQLAARTEVLPVAGHSPAVDDPPGTAKALLSFWADAES